MPCRLSKEEIVALRVLGEKNMKKTEIAATLGVSEGTVRYHLKRKEQGAIDGRHNKPQKADEYSKVISHWVESRSEGDRPVNVQELHEHLEIEHGYAGSYKSVLRYVRRHYPRPRMRTYRRVETPGGAQSQTDWAEFPQVIVGGNDEALSAFIMCLSHSRMVAVIWRRSKDQLSWLQSHNEAYARLGGVAAVNRIDNVKTALCRGAGSWGKSNRSTVPMPRQWDSTLMPVSHDPPKPRVRWNRRCTYHACVSILFGITSTVLNICSTGRISESRGGRNRPYARRLVKRLYAVGRMSSSFCGRLIVTRSRLTSSYHGRLAKTAWSISRAAAIAFLSRMQGGW